MGYDRAVRWIENNPGQHSVEEILKAIYITKDWTVPAMHQHTLDDWGVVA